jgi:uncharacterized protein
MRIAYLLLTLLLCVGALAQEVIYSDEIVLLALKESGDEKSGTVAKLRLDVIPGEERVFLETYPLTKVSTQASLRFAQQVACKELEVDCSKYDFLFSIEALPGIIGGPSAGSAATLLVSGALLGKKIPKDVAITGTINSGGTIGPVGGLKYKVEAAGNNGIRTVLLPKGTSEYSENNVTTNLTALGESLNLTVVEMTTIREVLSSVLNVSKKNLSGSIQVTSDYEETMKGVASDLCKRFEEYQKTDLNISELSNLTSNAKAAFENKSYYAAASFCFRANVAYVQKEFELANLSRNDLTKKLIRLKFEAEELLNETNSRKIQTLTDVQTYMAVRERIDETVSSVRDAALKLNGTDSLSSDIAYAQERLFSAKVWARFFSAADKEAVIDENRLREACVSKIAEAEERFNYIVSVIPDALDGTRDDIDAAYKRMSDKDYIMCVYTAAKAKATGNVLLNLLGVEESRFEEVTDIKLAIVKDELLRTQEKGVFPIIAYSYYEYAASLRNIDKVSSLLFSEYALELANLDIYFDHPKNKASFAPLIKTKSAAFFGGIAVGAIIVAISFQLMSNNSRKEDRRFSKRASSKGNQTQSGTRRRPKGKKR